MEKELISNIVTEVLRQLALKDEKDKIQIINENKKTMSRGKNNMSKILVLNFGSTSSKIAIFNDEVEITKTSIAHDTETLSQFKSVIDQRDFRKQVVLDWLESVNEPMESFDAIAPRGGNVHPIASGTYQVNQDMVDDLESGQFGTHASALASIIGYELYRSYGVPAYTTDPIVVDEKMPVARLSGHKILKRTANMHVLNHKAIARLAAKQIGKPYEKCNFVVTHMGGGITIGAHYNGKIIDANNGFDSDGPFSPERSGSLPVGDLVRLCFSGKYEKSEILRMINGEGGVKSYLGEVDMRKIETRIDQGDQEASLVYNAMAYQVAKEIGAYSVVSKQKLDAIVLTGGLAYSEKFTSQIIAYVGFLAPVLIFPGENEAATLAKGALDVLNHEITPLVYTK